MYYVPELETIPGSPAPHSTFPSTPTLISTSVTGKASKLRAIPFPSRPSPPSSPCREVSTPIDSGADDSDGPTLVVDTSAQVPPLPSSTPSGLCSLSSASVEVTEPEVPSIVIKADDDAGVNDQEVEAQEAFDNPKRNSINTLASFTSDRGRQRHSIISLGSVNSDRGRRISFSSVTRVVTTSIDHHSEVVAAERETLAEMHTSLVQDCAGSTPLLFVTPSHARPPSICSLDCLTPNNLKGPRGLSTMPRSPAPGMQASASSASLPAWFHSATSGLEDRINLVELSMPLWLDRAAGLKAPQNAQEKNAVVPATDVSALPGPTQRFIPGTLVLQRDEPEEDIDRGPGIAKELCMDPECSICATLNAREPFISGVGSCRSEKLCNQLRRSASQLIAKLDETGRVPSVAAGLSSLPVPLGSLPVRETPIVNEDGHRVLWFGRNNRATSRSARLHRKLRRLARKFKRLASHDISEGPIKEKLPPSPKAICIVSSRGPSEKSDNVVPILLKRLPSMVNWEDLDEGDARYESQETLNAPPPMRILGKGSVRSTSVPMNKRSTPWDCL